MYKCRDENLDLLRREVRAGWVCHAAFHACLKLAATYQLYRHRLIIRQEVMQKVNITRLAEGVAGGKDVAASAGASVAVASTRAATGSWPPPRFPLVSWLCSATLRAAKRQNRAWKRWGDHLNARFAAVINK